MCTSPNDDSPASRAAFLRAISLFAALDETDLAIIASSLRLKIYKKGEIIFYQEDDSHDLYLVRMGKVRIFKTTVAGNETSINIFSNYGIIGEFAALDDQPRSATAKAITDCQLYQLSQAQFLTHLQSIPGLGLSLAQLLTHKIRWTAGFAEAMAQYDAAGRLLHLLLLYNEQFGEALEEDKKYLLDLGLTQADLASLVGIRREWISQLLGDWQKRGLLVYDDRKIIILDLHRVQQERNSRIGESKKDAGW